MTHAELVTLAAGWLRTSKRCSVVITDMSSAAGETPDAIGWASMGSFLVECKTSRGDFLRDKDKPWRWRDGGMGAHRYFLAPADLIRPEELPEGWGLLEVKTGGKVTTRCGSDSRRHDKHGEVLLLLSALRRIGQAPPAGISVKCYTLETARRATIGIEPLPPFEDCP